MGTRVSGRLDVIKSTLDHVDLFASWPTSAKAALCDAAELWSFDKNESVTVAGEPVDALVVLAEGSVANERTWSNGKHMMSAVLRAGWPLKVPTLWDGFEAPYGLTARDACLAVFVPRNTFLKVVNSDVSLVKQVTDFICRQLRHEIIAVQMKTVFSLRCQLAMMLFYHAQSSFHTISTDEMKPEILPMDVTQDEFAAMLGCSRQKINRLMKEMEHGGLIRRHGRLVEIADPLLLMDAMEEDEPLSAELRNFIAQQRALLSK